LSQPREGDVVDSTVYTLRGYNGDEAACDKEVAARRRTNQSRLDAHPSTVHAHFATFEIERGDGKLLDKNGTLIPIPSLDKDDIANPTTEVGVAVGFAFRVPAAVKDGICIVGLKASLPQENVIPGVTTQNIQLVLPKTLPPDSFAPIRAGEFVFHTAGVPIDQTVSTPGQGIDVAAGQLVAVAGDAGPSTFPGAGAPEYNGDISFIASHLGSAGYPSSIAISSVVLDAFFLTNPTGPASLRDGPLTFYVAIQGIDQIGLVNVYYTVGSCGPCSGKQCGRK